MWAEIKGDEKQLIDLEWPYIQTEKWCLLSLSDGFVLTRYIFCKLDLICRFIISNNNNYFTFSQYHLWVKVVTNIEHNEVITIHVLNTANNNNYYYAHYTVGH